MGLLRRWGRKTPEDEFADEVAGLLRSLLGMKAKKVPDFALEIDRGDVPPTTLNLQNVYLEAQGLDGEARASHLRAAVLAMAPEPRPATWEAAAPRLLPAVRGEGWIAASGPIGVIRKPLAPFISVVCAIDSEHAMTFATDADLEAWGVSAEDALRAASDNLAKLPLEIMQSGPITAVLGPAGYISSWLVPPSMLRDIANGMGPRMIALAPARDQLFLVDTSDTAATVETMDQMLALYQAEPRQLSPVPYVLGERTVEPWQPPEGHPARPLVDKAQHVLAAVEYGQQQRRLHDLFTRAGEDVFVASYMLMERDDGSVWSWAGWVNQVTGSLVPQVDLLIIGGNHKLDDRFAVRWDDAIRLSGDTLQREAAYDPPLWRYRGWPDKKTLAALKMNAVPFPPAPE